MYIVITILVRREFKPPFSGLLHLEVSIMWYRSKET